MKQATSPVTAPATVRKPEPGSNAIGAQHPQALLSCKNDHVEQTGSDVNAGTRQTKVWN